MDLKLRTAIPALTLLCATSCFSLALEAKDFSAYYQHQPLLLAQKLDFPGDSKERTGVTDKEILIGSCNDQTGLLAERGAQLKIGANTLFNAVNDEGGINGRKIKLVVCDDKYDPDAAISCFNSCLKDKVFAGAFFIGSPPISKYVRMGDVEKMPMMGFCTGTPLVYEHSPYRFVLRPGYQDEIPRTVDALWSDGIRKFAIIYQEDAFGAAIREPAIKALSKYQAVPVVEASYSRKSQEIDDAYKKIKAANPEVVICGATSTSFKALIQKKDADKWNVLFAGPAVDTDFAVELGKASDGVLLTQVVPPLDEHLALVQKYNKLRKKYFPNSSMNATSLEAFQNAMVIVEGLKRAGKDLTRSNLISALESIHSFDTGAGSDWAVSFSPASHKGLSERAIYFAVMRNGNPVVLKPSELRSLIRSGKSS
jgi:ABC-type branched-subunit amino acid transport system substrate-binding protein